MKTRIIVLLLGILFLVPSLAPADGGDFGLGIILGSPTGFTGKYFFDNTSSVDVDLAWDFIYFGFAATGDYLYHFNNIVNSPVVGIRPYVGGGLHVGTRTIKRENEKDRENVFAIAGRGTVGMSFLFTKVPIELFLDISPGVWGVPKTDFYFAGGLGARYYF